MRTLGTAAVTAALLACTACGDEPAGTASNDASGCSEQGTVVARADLDGDGREEPVRLVARGRCGGLLLATSVKKVADVKGLDLGAKGAATVHLRGGPDLVLLWSRAHPRGGAQAHLFGAGGATGLREVTVDGNPVVPFVATDGGAAPMTATCTEDGGIALLRGTASEPPGVVLAWDIAETSYDLRGARVADISTRTVRRDAADPVLRKERPELFDGSLFTDCS